MASFRSDPTILMDGSGPADLGEAVFFKHLDRVLDLFCLVLLRHARMYGKQGRLRLRHHLSSTRRGFVKAATCECPLHFQHSVAGQKN